MIMQDNDRNEIALIKARLLIQLCGRFSSKSCEGESAEPVDCNADSPVCVCYSKTERNPNVTQNHRRYNGFNS